MKPYYLVPVLLNLSTFVSCKKESINTNLKSPVATATILTAANIDPNPTNVIVSSLYQHDTKEGLIITIADDLK